jgi:hypothetical protein
MHLPVSLLITGGLVEGSELVALEAAQTALPSYQ